MKVKAEVGMDRKASGSRDLLPTAFTSILEKISTASAEVLAAVFVDSEGECVDYSSRMDPYESKIVGALFLPIVFECAAASQRAGLGTAKTLVVRAEHRHYIVCRISVEYVLVIVLDAHSREHELRPVIDQAIEELRAEAHIPTPLWETPSKVCQVQVETRDARGWPFAPSLFEEEGIERKITDVLGYWQEHEEASGVDKDMFRVRSDDGRELTLEFNRTTQVWVRYEQRLP